MTISRTSATTSCLSSEYPAAATSDGVTSTIDSVARSALSESSYVDPRSGRIVRDVLRHLTNFLPETKDIQALPPAVLVDIINCKRISLRELGITESENLSTWLKSLGESKNHLRCLDLGDIPLSDEIIELLPPTLEELRICDCSDDTLLKLSNHLVNLKKLNLCWSNSVTGCHFDKLNLCFIDNIIGCHFDKLPEGLQELTCWRTAVTDTAISKLSSRCPQLKKLNIIFNSDVTGIFFDQLPEELQELTCSGTAVTDTVISKLLARCTNLRSLDISSSSALTGASFDLLPVGLQELACSTCRITDDAIAKLNHCINLVKLNIGWNGGVTGSTFDLLPISLQHLVCDNCSIEDETIIKLSKCTNLVFLGMSISDKLHEILKTHLPHLLPELA